jgi:fatty acid desaturase
MLSEEERKRLEAIEYQLERDEPKLARRFADPHARTIRWVIIAMVVCSVALVVAVIAGWWALAVLLLLPGLMVSLGTLFWYRSDT